MMLLLEVILGFAIGLSLGLLGGGGSILTVPALVYLVGQTPQAAVTTSLAIVGANSALGASFHQTQSTLNWKVALLFGGTGILAAYFASGISKLLPPAVLLITFALLMLVIGILMVIRSSNMESMTYSPRPLWVVLASGLGVGLLTGILGVGGGFLIVPALVMFVGLPMQVAVGTSLVIIALNSFAGLAGHLGKSANLLLIVIFTLAGLAGTFAGTRLNKHLPAEKVQKLFAWFVMVLAIFLLVDNFHKIIIR